MWNVYRRRDRQAEKQTYIQRDGVQVIRKIYLNLRSRWTKICPHNTWGNRSFPNQFWKGQTTFFALEINATIHTIQLSACYFLIIDYINVNPALKMPYRCKSWIIKINVVIVRESVLWVVKTICMDI